MEGMRSVLVAVTLAILWAPEAAAEIFKFTKPDGTVVYTDKLSDLPRERRVHYNKMLAEREKAAQQAKEEAEDRASALTEAEEERARLVAEVEARRADARERNAARLRELDEVIELLSARAQELQAQKARWKRKIGDARAELKARLAEFEKVQEEWAALAIKVDYAQFPGQRQRQQELRERLDALEPQIDALIHRIEVEIPAQARRAGIPPGWLRN